jgi:acetylornithine/N-succinyldiaminopimelate aminotransferase
MPTNHELIGIAEAVQLPNYRPAPFVLSRGQGCHVWDVEGHRYLDFSGGIAVTSVGHAHPALAAAIAEQAGRLLHVSNLFYNDRAIELAAEIVRRTPFSRVYFANSGAEANEALYKLARRWHYEHGRPERVEFVTALRSFHGRTMGALSLTGQPKYRVGMGPGLPGVHHVPYGDLAALTEKLSSRTAAVLLEPVQGEGGLVVPPEGYLAGVRAACDQAGALLLYDEVQSGFGRCGTFMGWELSGVEPDGCAMAKGMGGGFPIGGIAVKEHLADGLPPGAHASTFGGGALACAAGLAVLRIMEDEDLLANCRARASELRAGLEAMVADPALPAAAEARGVGLWQGIHVADSVDAAALMVRLREEENLLVSIAGGTVLRLAPPLCVKSGAVEDALARIRRVFADVAVAGEAA